MTAVHWAVAAHNAPMGALCGAPIASDREITIIAWEITCDDCSGALNAAQAALDQLHEEESRR